MWMGGEFRCGWEESLGVDGRSLGVNGRSLGVDGRSLGVDGMFRCGWEEFIVDVVRMWGLDVDGRRGSIL